MTNSIPNLTATVVTFSELIIEIETCGPIYEVHWCEEASSKKI